MNEPTIPAQLTEALGRIEALSSELTATKAELQSAKSALMTANEQLATATAAVQSGQSEITALNEKLNTSVIAFSEIAAKCANLEASEKDLNVRAAAIATEQMAKVGQTPLVTDIKTAKSTSASQEPLKGFARVLNAFKSQKN